MPEGFVVDTRFSFDESTNKVTIELKPVGENPGIQEQKTITLDNLKDFNGSRKQVIDAFDSMLPVGMRAVDYEPLVEQIDRALGYEDEKN